MPTVLQLSGQCTKLAPPVPRILFIVPTDYDALKLKGVDRMIFDRAEGGYFERVVTVHPISFKSRCIELDTVHILYELGLDVFGKGMRYRMLRAIASPLQLLRVVLVTLRLVRKERIDIIRGNDPYWIGLITMIVAKLSGRPWCISIHTDYEKSFKLIGRGESFTFFGWQWPARLVNRVVLAKADLVLPIRESLKLWAVASGAPPENIRVIPHGIDSAALVLEAEHDVRSLFGIHPSSQILSFVGRLSPINYLFDLLEVARRLIKRRKDFCLVIAGGGELETWLHSKLAADSELAEVVRLVGFQPRGVCFALRMQSTASICLMGGFSLIEACLAAKPVIAYDVAWHSELVQTGSTGYLLREGDIDGVAEALNSCIDNPIQAIAMGQRARMLMLSKHELVATSKIKIQCYEDLLFHGRRKRRAHL